MKIRKNKIRNIFYFGMITIVMILMALLSVTYISAFKSQTETKIRQLTTGIYDMKKIYVKDVVDRTVQSIDIERERIIALEIEKIDFLENVIEKLSLEKRESRDIYAHLIADGIDFHDIQVLIYDRKTQRIAYQINSTIKIDAFNNEKAFLAAYTVSDLIRIVTNDNYFVVLSSDIKRIDNLVKSAMIYRIRKDVLVDNGYIWVDKIINYDGGDDFAFRLVHPNLPETEGDFLSTNYTDIMGNKPYFNEIEGINEKGELYLEYYFKKKDSEEISRKLSYVKLYKPYDWMIATGVYLDDVDTVVENETREMKATQKTFILKTIFMMGLSFLLAITLIYIFEKLIYRLIQDFQNEVNQKNIELEIEKEKIEAIANLDSLTGLLTRRAMQDRLQRAQADAKDQNVCYSIGIGDVDYFKKINDKYGHQAGDYVLIALSNLFKQNLQEPYAIARWGGEEFLFLLNASTIEEAVISMNNLRERVAQTDFEYEGHKISVRISIGVTGNTSELQPVYAMLKEADKNLYIAKSTGRNKVVS